MTKHEKPETINLKLHNFSDIDDISLEGVLGGTNCGLQTFYGPFGMIQGV